MLRTAVGIETDAENVPTHQYLIVARKKQLPCHCHGAHQNQSPQRARTGHTVKRMDAWPTATLLKKTKSHRLRPHWA
jgi:hypothetical protein